jgi:hypothetical protein
MVFKESALGKLKAETKIDLWGIFYYFIFSNESINIEFTFFYTKIKVYIVLFAEPEVWFSNILFDAILTIFIFKPNFKL